MTSNAILLTGALFFLIPFTMGASMAIGAEVYECECTLDVTFDTSVPQIVSISCSEETCGGTTPCGSQFDTCTLLAIDHAGDDVFTCLCCIDPNQCCVGHCLGIFHNETSSANCLEQTCTQSSVEGICQATITQTGPPEFRFRDCCGQY